MEVMITLRSSSEKVVEKDAPSRILFQLFNLLPVFRFQYGFQEFHQFLLPGGPCPSPDLAVLAPLSSFPEFAVPVLVVLGRVEVMITLRSSSEKVVEKDAPSRSQRVEETDSQGGSRTTQENEREETTVYEEGEDGKRTP